MCPECNHSILLRHQLLPNGDHQCLVCICIHKCDECPHFPIDPDCGHYLGCNCKNKYGTWADRMRKNG